MARKLVNHDPAILSAGAVALSSSAILAALVGHLRRIDAVSEEAEREIYEDALQMLEEGQGGDDMRKNEDGSEYWTVYDIMTGVPAVVNGTTLNTCEMEEADDLVDLLNAEYIARRGGMTH